MSCYSPASTPEDLVRDPAPGKRKEIPEHQQSSNPAQWKTQQIKETKAIQKPIKIVLSSWDSL